MKHLVVVVKFFFKMQEISVKCGRVGNQANLDPTKCGRVGVSVKLSAESRILKFNVFQSS